MLRRGVYRIVALAVLTTAPMVLVAQDSTNGTPAIEAEAQWLALVDAGNYDNSWKTASAFLRNAVPEKTFAEGVEKARAPLGAVRTRALKEARPTTTLPGMPDGHYIVAQYNTAFANKAAAVETLTALQEPDGSWRIAGYFIR